MTSRLTHATKALPRGFPSGQQALESGTRRNILRAAGARCLGARQFRTLDAEKCCYPEQEQQQHHRKREPYPSTKPTLRLITHSSGATITKHFTRSLLSLISRRPYSKMSKSDDQVIEEFNEYVNMTSSELDKWLKTEDSEGAGWGDGDESVGHKSGRTITDILKRNPKKDPSKYTDDDLQHMRKVASYCKRHLAQESHLKDSKSKEELQESKAYRSLKNWGHDMLK